MEKPDERSVVDGLSIPMFEFARKNILDAIVLRGRGDVEQGIMLMPNSREDFTSNCRRDRLINLNMVATLTRFRSHCCQDLSFPPIPEINGRSEVFAHFAQPTYLIMSVHLRARISSSPYLTTPDGSV